VLDGWRGISILLVLAGHMLPFGPKWLELNSMVSAAGLSVFFCLSGFLIVSMLLRDRGILPFFVRRLFRILPLAWLALLAILLVQRPATDAWYSNLLFYANLVPNALQPHGDHLWSLCVEMQFYVAVGLAVAIFGSRSLPFLVPAACVAITLVRMTYGVHFSIITWFRVDEILSGGMLALFINVPRLAQVARNGSLIITTLLIIALFLSSHERLGPVTYFRPYITALLIGSTLYGQKGLLQAALSSKLLSYFAKTSYALYVIHPLTYAGWLGEGEILTKYTKRLFGVVLTFFSAHFSTMYYEKYWNELGHKLASHIKQRITKESGYRSQPSA